MSGLNYDGINIVNYIAHPGARHFARTSAGHQLLDEQDAIYRDSQPHVRPVEPERFGGIASEAYKIWTGLAHNQ